MSVSARDKKILMLVVPVVLLVGYWFLLLAPQRQEAKDAASDLAKQEKRRDEAQSELNGLNQAKADFATNYARVVKLGKAIPASVDMPSLIVQLESAARGTGIEFTKVAAGERQEATAPAPQSGSSGQAASAPGSAAQNAQGARNNADNTSAQHESAAQNSGVDSKDTKTSTSKGAGLPVGGGSAGAAAGSGGSTCAPGLECVPLEFEFRGDFFDLADFFHGLKRFVKNANNRLVVRGRLMTVDGLKFSSDDELFPDLKAEVKATVYLAPKSEGATAGATPQGPSQTTPAGTGGDQQTPAPTTPTATATP